MVPVEQNKKQPGRGLVITGIVLMGIAVLSVGVTVAVFGSRLDLNEFGRDVAINGELESDVPGLMGFRIIESLSSDDDTMTVAVALSSSSTAFDCEIVDVRGDPVEVRRGSSTDTFVSGDVNAGWTVAVVAEELGPGEYSARCDVAGEPSSAPPAQFTVGRILTDSEVFDLFGPALAILAAIVVGGLSGLVGLILLIVGLVRRNKAKKQPPGAPGPTPGQPPGTQSPPGGPPQQSPWGAATPPGPPQQPGPPTPPTGPPTAPPESPWERPPAGRPPSPE